MKSQAPPRLATWFINKYGSQSTTDSAIGDLMEQYERGRGPAWYWRQALSLVFADLVGDLRSRWARVLVGLGIGWIAWLSLQFLSAWLLILTYVLGRPGQYSFQVTADLIPFVVLRWTIGDLYGIPEVSLLAVLLHVSTLFAVGVMLTGFARGEPQTLVLSFTLTFIIASVVEAIANIASPGAFRFTPTLFLYGFAILIGPVALLVGGSLGRKKFSAAPAPGR